MRSLRASCPKFDEEIGSRPVSFAREHVLSVEGRESRTPYVSWIPVRAAFADLVGMTLERCSEFMRLHHRPVAHLATRYRRTSLAISLALSRRVNRSSRSISK
jgi:hypothetical protein